MKGILLTPDHAAQRTVVSTIDVAEDVLGAARMDHVHQLLDCSSAQIHRLPEMGRFAGHVIVVDSAGLWREPPGFLFMPALLPTPFAGDALILGYEETPSGVRPRPARIEEADRRSIGICAYCTPKFAQAAQSLHERNLQRSPAPAAPHIHEDVRH